MTTEEVDKVLNAFDQILSVSGGQKITDILNQFTDKIPKDVQPIVLAQVKEDIAKSLSDGLAQTTSELNNVTSNPDIMEAIKKTIGPQDD